MENKYEKHLILSEFGENNQKLIKNTTVLIVGIGGIGCQVLTQLALNGFENIGICDFDIVSKSNLHRQFIYTLDDAENKREKIECAQKFILERNNINISKYSLKITNKNVNKIIKDYEIIIDCTDNIFTRYILNDACYLSNKVYIFASGIQTSCQLSIFDNSITNKYKCCCLRCIFPNIDNQTCESEGVLGTIPNLIGMLTANEVIKFICKIGESLMGKLLTYNINTGFYTINIERKNPNCLLCGNMKIINKDNFESLAIYDEICSFDNINYSITTDKILNIDSSFNIYKDIIFLEEKKSLDDYFNTYKNIIHLVHLIDSKRLSDDFKKNELLIFDCKNKIRSKILVNKLRKTLDTNNIYKDRIFYLV